MRDRAGLAPRVIAGVAIAASIAVLVAACSPGADYPAILDRPAPRAEQPMSPDQVQRATNSLISDRSQLTAEAQAAQASAVASGMSPPATTGTVPRAGAVPKP